MNTQALGKANPDLATGIDARSRPRGLGDFYAFYQRWSSQVFAFCLLLCGDRAQPEWFTEEAFAWYFRRADSVALRSKPHIPVALLRSATDFVRKYGIRRPDADLNNLNRDLLELPFKRRAAFILVSVMGVQASAAAVALRLSRGQLASCWLEAALQLHHLSRGFGEPIEMPAAA